MGATQPGMWRSHDPRLRNTELLLVKFTSALHKVSCHNSEKEASASTPSYVGAPSLRQGLMTTRHTKAGTKTRLKASSVRAAITV